VKHPKQYELYNIEYENKILDDMIFCKSIEDDDTFYATLSINPIQVHMEYYDSYEECLNGYTKFLNEGDAGITNVYDLKDEINNCKILKRLHNLEKLTEYSI
jgi:hypothetical protein